MSTANQDIIVGKRISRLLSTDFLQDEDLFVISRKQDADYLSSLNTEFGVLWKDVGQRLLENNEFLDGLYSYLSSRLLNDRKFIEGISSQIEPTPVVGMITYDSCYPEDSM